MIDRFRLSRQLFVRLEELGVAAEAVARAAGLPPEWSQADRLLLDTGQLFAFWEAVDASGGDPVLGLRLGSAHDQVERFDAIMLTALSASSFRDALARAGRYKRLTCPEQITVVEDAGEARVQFEWLLAHRAPPTLLQDLCFAWIVGIGRLGTGTAVTPRRVDFARAPGHRDLYEAHFGCPVHFGAAIDTLVFASADLDRPFRTHNADLLATLAPQLEADLADRRTSTASAQVKSTVKRLLAEGRPDLRAVARELGVSTRTLQRRLAEEGVTYQQQLEAARRELARHYLLHADVDPSEAAHLLGYEDASSFFRAFQQWEGDSPGRWRAQHAAGGGTPPATGRRRDLIASLR